MPTVLVVDDSPLDRRRAGALLEKRYGLTEAEKRTGVQVLYATNGREALAIMKTDAPDVVLTDLQMPEMNGLELVETARADFPTIPVILMTGHGSEDIAAQALQRGAASYVPKRNLARDLLETVEGLLSLHQEAREQQQLAALLAESETLFVLPNDLSLIGPLVGYLKGRLAWMQVGDEISRLRVTVALREALVNAIEHGNLEVSSELKEQSDRAFAQTIEERRDDPVYGSRRVHVRARETAAEVVYAIRDEGPGFDPTSLPDPTDPENLEKSSGRGLMLMRAFMDEVRHSPRGNEITLVKRRDR